MCVESYAFALAKVACDNSLSEAMAAGTWGVELWDQRDPIALHSLHGLTVLDKYAAFLKDRIKIEEEYIKSIRRLVKQYLGQNNKKKDEKQEENLLYSYEESFKSFLGEHKDYALQKEVVWKEIQKSVVEEMQKLSAESKLDIKKTAEKLTECKNQLDIRQRMLTATKKKFEQANEESCSALKSYIVADENLAVTPREVMKKKETSLEKHKLCNTALDEYQLSLENYNDQQTFYYTTQLPGVINTEFQEPNESRLDQISLFLQKYAKIQEDGMPYVKKLFERISDTARAIQPQNDSKIFISLQKSDVVPPGPWEMETSLPSPWDVFDTLKPEVRKEKYQIFMADLQEQLERWEQKKLGSKKIKDTSEIFGGNIRDIRVQIDKYERYCEEIRSLLSRFREHLETLQVSNSQVDFQPDHALSGSDMTAGETDKAQSEGNGSQLDINSTPPVPSSHSGSYVSLVKPPVDLVNTLQDSKLYKSVQDSSPLSSDAEFHEADNEEDGEDDSRCVVLYDFTGTNDNELTAFAGEELFLTESDDIDGWIRVRRGTEEGYMPFSYIEII